MERIVLKVGGSELDGVSRQSLAPRQEADFVDGLIAALGTLRQKYAVSLVHGGGKTIANLQSRLGLVPRAVDGLRVTDDESLDVAEMVLSGLVNKRLVARLVTGGVPAVGLSGVDNGLFRTAKMAHPSGDLGWVGDIVDTHAADVEALLSLGVVPVISPISLGVDGHTYNVNADHAALALASALGAAELVFVSNVPGVLCSNESAERACAPLLTSQQVDELVACGEIQGGMIPKVRSALGALDAGVHCVRITDLEGLACDGGTRFVKESHIHRPVFSEKAGL